MPSDPNTPRIGSPVGGSTLMTSAPQSASRAAVAGAATHTPISTTRRPASALEAHEGTGRACAARSRSRFFSTLPVALSGSSAMTSTTRGTL